METIVNNIFYKFVPSSVVSFEDISKENLVLKNDVYEKYYSNAKINGELIICNDPKLLRSHDKKIIQETYDEYLESLERRNPKKDMWIYNIINGVSEQESILYRDDKCLIIPSYVWNGKNIDKLHLLCIPTDITLRSIRSLDSSHIGLLEYMKNITCNIITSKYNVDLCYIKIFFHYSPSAYHLHIHFVNTHNTETHSSVEYSHELNNVIFNLSIYSDYYKKIIMNKRV